MAEWVPRCPRHRRRAPQAQGTTGAGAGARDGQGGSVNARNLRQSKEETETWNSPVVWFGGGATSVQRPCCLNLI